MRFCMSRNRTRKRAQVSRLTGRRQGIEGQRFAQRCQPPVAGLDVDGGSTPARSSPIVITEIANSSVGRLGEGSPDSWQ